MKNTKLLLLLLILSFGIALGQKKSSEKYYLDYYKLAKTSDNFHGYSCDEYGQDLSFMIYNENEISGKGGGWLIYKNGSKMSNDLSKKLYPTERLYGIYFIKDLFEENSVNPYVNKSFLEKFDIYLHLIPPKYLKKVRLCDRDDYEDPCYWDYYETYPLEVIVYKRSWGTDYFTIYDTIQISSEEEDKWYGGYKFREKILRDSNTYYIPIQNRIFDNTFITLDLLQTASEEELQKLKKSQLRILRNAIYARLGYQFKSQDLQDFFHQFDWYNTITKGNITNNDIYLSDEEKKRIALIKDMEDSK